MGGYLLAGGRGWNYDAWGPACYSVEAADVITADGKMLRVSEEQHPELLWAMRGAGPGFFAVVVRFHLRVYPMPKSIGTAFDLYPIELCHEVISWLDEVRADWPCETRAIFTRAPDVLGNDDPVLMVAGTVFTESEQATRSLLQVMESCPARSRALHSQVTDRTDFEALFDRRDAQYPTGLRWLADSVLSEADTATLLVGVAEEYVRAPSTRSHILIALPRTMLPAATAPGASLSSDGTSDLHVYATWENPKDDGQNIDWMEATMAGMAEVASGHYIGEADLMRWPPENCYSAGSWARLQELRAQYDPSGVFQPPLRPSGHPNQ